MEHRNTITGDAVYTTDESKLHTKKVGCTVKRYFRYTQRWVMARCEEYMVKNDNWIFVSNKPLEQCV